ncbi:ATP-binding protein [Solitalea sp. MAHUQ-68]|uniref:histidine kinase n=1 Tax=Solitalea agri TaxID=2953739 RepID=A0A9X2F977_9SPHI|nr:ATP-binding protein [Solitalea agri]MCO4294646.1 ATP-binding protein [Solitalea agri]
MINYITIVIIDDDEEDFILIKHYLEQVPNQKYLIKRAANYDEALVFFNEPGIDVFLVDYKLGKYKGIEILNIAKVYDVNAPFIIVTGKGNLNIDKEVMRAGAYDYLIKDELSTDILERSVRYSIERFNQFKIIENKEKQYKDIFEKSGEIILLTNQSGKILDANPAAINRFEKSLPEMLNLKILHLVDEKEQLKFWEAVITKQLEGEIFTFFSVPMTKKISGLVSFIEQDDFNYQFIIHDVTKITIKETERREEEKFAATGRIARVIAHEVKNPLTNVNFAINELKDDNKDPEKKVVIDIIERNCQRINSLITELLNSTRFSHLNLARQDINNAIREAIKGAQDFASQKNVKIQSALSPIEPFFIDGEKIKVALMNIIINGIEAIDNANGEISIGSYTENNRVMVSINDNGKGIPPENINQIFEAFYTNGKDTGTGLGLTTSQNIILNHNGAIFVESDTETGTTFTITLIPHELKELYLKEKHPLE